jgi:hypothetical protein
LIKDDVIAKQQAYDKLAALAEKHRLDMAKISGKMAQEQKSTWDKSLAPITDAFEKTISGIIQGTTTMQKGLSNIFKSIALEFANLSIKMVVQWVSDRAREVFASKTAETLKVAAAAEGSVATKAISAKTGLAEIMNNAYKAAAGAYNAMVSIPIVGPVLAPIAAGVAFAGVAAFGSSISSAEGGYDIPAGVNPITQLHEKEMVLPKAQAEAVRSMADGGGGGGVVNFHVTAMDSKDVARLFKDNGHHLAAALKQQVRNFNTGR